MNKYSQILKVHLNNGQKKPKSSYLQQTKQPLTSIIDERASVTEPT
uniref:Uncharacterized protein n=1 Tax=Rhizophora mucronata TaxID=61149 RepID=A0A2P2IM36_RHIMU